MLNEEARRLEASPYEYTQDREHDLSSVWIHGPLPELPPCKECGIQGAHFCTGKPVGGDRTWEPGSAPRSTSRPLVTPVSPSAPLGQSGWLCPACGKGNAPWVAQCPCGGRSEVSDKTNPPVIPDPPRTDIPLKGTVTTKCDKCKDTGWVPSKQMIGGRAHMESIMMRCPEGCPSSFQTFNEDSP